LENIMKKAHLVATAGAALLAGTMFVAAQGLQKQAPGGEGGAQGQTQREPGSQPGQKGKQPGKKETGKQGLSRQRAGDQQRETGRQGQQDQPKEKRQGKSKGSPREGQQGQRIREGQSGRSQKGQAREGGSVNLTTEQRTRVRERVLARGPRESNVNFSLNVGAVVPRTVRVVAVDPILVEYYPRYRGYLYFIVGDQIIIVDRRYRIVAIIDV
jgi:hypothetical protein